MEKIFDRKLSAFLQLLLVVQVLWCLGVVANQVIFNSSLKLFFDRDHPMEQKLQFVLGFDYAISLQMAQMPADAGILLVTSDPIFFINYYALPRKMYVYPGVSKDEDVKKVPQSWLKEKGITFVLLYHPSYNPPSVRVMQLQNGAQKI